MQKCFLAFVLLASAFSFATATVTGNLVDPATGAVTSNTFVRFAIRNCGGNQPRIVGTAVIAKPFYDIIPDSVTGAISGTLYDNDQIDCGNNLNTWYGVVIYRNGKAGVEIPYQLSTGPFDLNSATPINTNPTSTYSGNALVTNPVADQTVAQAANTTFAVSQGKVNFSAAQATSPIKTDILANIPTSCTASATQRDMYIASDVTDGQNVYVCKSDGSGFVVVGAVGNSVNGFPAATASTAGTPVPDFYSGNDTVLEIAGGVDGTGTVSVARSGTMQTPGLTSTGNWTLSQMSAPSSPTITVTGGAAGNYTYKVVAKAGTGTSTAGTQTTTVGPTTLDTTHYNTITWAAVAGTPSSYDIYRSSGGATQGKIGNVLSTATTLTLQDTGIAGDATTAPTTNTTGVLTAYQVTTTGPAAIDSIEASAPSAPASTHWVLYPKTTSGWCQKNSAGTESCIATGSTPLSTKGDLFTWDTANQRLAVGSNTQVLTADSTQATGIKWAAAPVAPTTTKGDLAGFSTLSARVPVGTDGQCLIADSTQVLGVKYGSCGGSPLSTKGDIFTHSSVDARLPVGTDGQVLVADSSQTTGLAWNAQPATQLFGYCAGISNSSSTLSIQNFGPTSASCTASQVSRAMRVGSAGVLRNLRVVSDAGKVAGSGVFTVYVCTVANQVACSSLTTSSITCTVGTGQACNDTTHTQAIAAGDAVVIKYTTQATETLGNIMVTLEKTVN